MEPGETVGSSFQEAKSHVLLEWSDWQGWPVSLLCRVNREYSSISALHGRVPRLSGDMLVFASGSCRHAKAQSHSE